jgi:hypothetical protein
MVEEAARQDLAWSRQPCKYSHRDSSLSKSIKSEGRTALTPADRSFLGGGGQDEAGPAEFSSWGWPEEGVQVTGTIPAQLKRKYGRSMN